MEPSQLGSLKGLIRTKDTRGFILVRPLKVKVRPTSSWVGIDVSMTRERDTLCLALDELFLALSHQGVAPLYREVDAQRLSESRPAHKQCPARSLTILSVQYKSCAYGGLPLRALSRLWALGPY